jgi:fructose-specific phosphotransferase system IIA component
MDGICKRLTERCILLDLQGPDKEHLIRAMVDSLASCHPVEDTEHLVQDILAREALATTCIGSGAAVPHAHSGMVERTVIAAARLSPPVDLAAPDGEPVSLVFLLVGPPRHAMSHLKLLSKLARLLHDKTFRQRLASSTSAQEFHALICAKETQG